MRQEISLQRLQRALRELDLRAKYDRANDALVLRFPQHVALFSIGDDLLRARALWLGGAKQAHEAFAVLEFADNWNRTEAIPKCTLDNGGDAGAAPELTWEQCLLLEGGATNAQLEDFVWTFLTRVTLAVTRAAAALPHLAPVNEEAEMDEVADAASTWDTDSEMQAGGAND